MKNLRVNCRNCVFKFTIPNDHADLFKIGRIQEDGTIDHTIIMSKVSNDLACCPACGALLEATALKKVLDATYN